MRDRLRSIRHPGLLMLALMSSISTVRADALYSVTDLGPANPSAAFLSGKSQIDPTGNYLNALGAADRAAFQAESFDVFAHPGTGYGSVAATADLSGLIIASAALGAGGVRSMVTGNNDGEYIGQGWARISSGETDVTVQYVPGSHTIQYNDFNPYTWNEQGKQSPGYVLPVTLPNAPTMSTLDVTLGGINDHGYIIYNMPSYGVKGGHSVVLGWTPYILGQNIPAAPKQGAVQLPGLGGTFGIANALNNSNQVVGWSQIASGAQHAFLYANGTTQDLNSLIRQISGITLVDAVGVDALGRIVAFGTDASGQMEEYLLTPQGTAVPEPSTLVVFAGLGIAVFFIKLKMQMGAPIRRRSVAGRFKLTT